MNVLSRGNYIARAENGATGIIHAIAQNNRVVYRIAAEDADGLHYLESRKRAKSFKFADTATKAQYDFGFSEVHLTVSPEALSLLTHERETNAKLSETFAKRGSLKEFVEKHGFYYPDVASVIQGTRRIADIQIALAARLGVPPHELWLDFQES